MAYKPGVVVFHYPCSDGITAAGVVFNYYEGDSNIEFVRGNYSRDVDPMDFIEQFRDKDVLMVDFSFPADILEKISSSANSVVILDHHITAQNALEQYTVEGNFDNENLNVNGIEDVLKEQKIVAIFDMDESGASLAWKFFNPSSTIPDYINYVRDIDLNKLELPRVHDFKWGARALPLTVEGNANTIRTANITTIQDGGISIRQFVETRLGQLHDESHEGVWYNIPFKWAITDYAFASDLANSFVLQGYRFGVAVYFTKAGLGLSLRSAADLDCSAIAKELGGGGHKQAAGVNVPWDEVEGFIEGLYDAGVITEEMFQ